MMEIFRCKEQGCRKCLGKINSDGCLEIDSNRIHEKVIMRSGVVICKNRGGHFGGKEISYEFKRVADATGK